MGNSNVYKHLFSHKWVSIFVFVIAWLNKSWMCVVHGSLLGDKSIYALMSVNAVNGNGYTETFYFLEQPDTAFYFSNPSFQSPVYSLLISIPLLFTDNVFLATIVVDIFSWFLCLIAIRRLLVQTGVAIHTVNIAVLITGFFLFPHEIHSGPKDTLSLALLLWALFLLIRYINAGKHDFKRGVISGIFFLLPGLVKFIYIPVLLFLLLIVLFFFFYKKEKRYLKFLGGALLSSVLFLFTIFLLYKSTQQKPSSEIRYVINRAASFVESPQQYGFNPENLKMLYPFVPGSFLNIEIAGTIVVDKIGVAIESAQMIFSIINYLLIGWFIYLLVRFVYKQRHKPLAPISTFSIAGGLLAVMIFVMMFLLALFFIPIRYRGNDIAMSFASEGRAFIYIIVFLQMVSYVWLWDRIRILSRVWKFITILAFFLLCVHALHGVYYSSKKLIKDFESPNLNTGKYKIPVLKWFEKFKSDNPGRKITIVTEVSHIRWLLLLNKEIVYSDPVTLSEKEIPLSEDESRVVIIYKFDRERYKNFQMLKNVRTLNNFGEYLVYIQENKAH